MKLLQTIRNCRKEYLHLKENKFCVGCTAFSPGFASSGMCMKNRGSWEHSTKDCFDVCDCDGFIATKPRPFRIIKEELLMWWWDITWRIKHRKSVMGNARAAHGSTTAVAQNGTELTW